MPVGLYDGILVACGIRRHFDGSVRSSYFSIFYLWFCNVTVVALKKTIGVALAVSVPFSDRDSCVAATLAWNCDALKCCVAAARRIASGWCNLLVLVRRPDMSFLSARPFVTTALIWASALIFYSRDIIFRRFKNSRSKISISNSASKLSCEEWFCAVIKRAERKC